MALTFKMDTSPLVAAASRYSGVAGVSTRAAWTQFLRGLTRRVVGITPPANQASGRGPGGAITSEDKKRGERALARDLEAIFVPVERARVGPRGESDVAAIHRRVFIAKKIPGRRLRNDRKQPYFVDATGLRALHKQLRARVGRLAAQWNSGVVSVGARSPAWVARHGEAKGKHRIVFSPGTFFFQMSATDVPDSLRAELVRRITIAERYQVRAGERAMAAILLKAAGRSGFAVRE